MQRSVPVLFRVSSSVCINTKTSTGLTGVPVIPNARLILKDLYERIMDKSTQELPEDLPYRIDLQNVMKHRLKIIEEEEDCAIIEERIKYDIVENLIHQARQELKEALPAIIESKMWESPGWKTTQIPIVFKEIGDGPMDLSSFSEDDLKTHGRAEEIAKAEDEKKKQEAENASTQKKE